MGLGTFLFIMKVTVIMISCFLKFYIHVTGERKQTLHSVCINDFHLSVKLLKLFCRLEQHLKTATTIKSTELVPWIVPNILLNCYYNFYSAS